MRNLMSSPHNAGIFAEGLGKRYGDLWALRDVDHDVVADPATVRTKFGLAGQQATVDGLLTARANLEMVGRLYHLPRAVVRARADELLDRLSLSDAADRLVKTFSGGMRRRLDLAASLMA